ncbi:mitochondrial metal transporter 2 [Ceratobasidium sp. AG-Ba]|nr:mitochondrial metal transporter 2 [Ceratobasidium sp. AG-Ba]
MLISLLILQQGVSLTWGAFGDFTDAGVPSPTENELAALVTPLLTRDGLPGINNVRVVRSGSVMFVDLTADVPVQMTVSDEHGVEAQIRDAIMESRSEVKEVRVHLHAVEEGQASGDGTGGFPC